ncbi:MAG: SLBB domain-containing protein, partial [Prolixibacteraceae bacterium]|nr:SLBB domain-containing protein [Prolixibacteraceae bacterium]
MLNKLKRYRDDKYRRRKLVFWLGLCSVGLLAVFLLFVWPLLKPEPKRELIRAGICGAVNSPAVYLLAKGADLAMLVRMAGGFTPAADFARVNLDRLVMHDTIYHIPARGVAGGLPSLMDALKEPLSAPAADISNLVAAEMGQKEIRKFTILYVGLPSVFVLITYAPDLKRIQFTHIPHSALFLNNDYRLQDIFFTVNIKPTVKLLENRLKQKID